MLATLVLQLAIFNTPAEAMRELIDRKPRVIAFGEYHETKQNGASAKPAIVRFTNEVLQSLPPASDVIVETWITKGNCGATEKTVVAKVEQSTQRPESTETRSRVTRRTSSSSPATSTNRCRRRTAPSTT
jgi:hypothetical protein